MQTSTLDCNWSDVGSPGSRATSFHTCQVLRPRRVAQALALTSVLPSASQRRRHPGYESLRGSMAGLCAPLPTLRRRPYGRQRTARGQCGSLLRHRVGLAPTTRCRSPGALRKILDATSRWTDNWTSLHITHKSYSENPLPSAAPYRTKCTRGFMPLTATSGLSFRYAFVLNIGFGSRPSRAPNLT
jgi:hypothetical protein